MFGISVDMVTLEEATMRVLAMAKRREKSVVVTPNVDHIITLQHDSEFLGVYKSAGLVVADGMPLVWLSRILPGKPLPERVTGADLLETVCQKAAEEGVSVALLGGNPGVAAQAATCLQKRYPGLLIKGVYSPPFGFENDKEECARIVKLVNEWKPDILFVGVGAPKQEKWSARYLEELDCGPILCVGASFDFAAGIVRRAPVWMQKLGLEWFWRMLHEPRRLVKRYLGRDLMFISLAVKEIVVQYAHKKHG